MAYQLPKLLILPIFLFSAIFTTTATTTTTTTNTPYKLANELCNHKDVVAKKQFCLDIFKSDPRGASASNNLTLFKIAMKIGISKLSKIINYFTEVGNSKPDLKKTLDLCTGQYYGHVMATLRVYKREVVASGGAVDDPSLVSYDFGLAKIDILDCGESLKSAGIRDESLWKSNEEGMNYFLVCYEITKVVTNTTD